MTDMQTKDTRKKDTWQRARLGALVTGLLPLVGFVFPFVNLQGKNLTGVSFLATILKNLSADRGHLLLGGGAALLLLLLSALCAVVSFIVYHKRSYDGARRGLPEIVGMASMVVSALAVFFQTISILYVKKAVEGAGLTDSFMVKDLGAGYYLTVIFAYLGLIWAMKKMRIHPGHIVLVIMSVVWLFPIFYIVMNSFRGEGSFYVNYIIPKQFSLENYRQLFDAGSKFHYGRWYVNTFVVAAFACVCSSLIVLATAYSLSRIRFRGRKVIMNFLLILGMFPAFMSMIAVYYILKGMGLAQSLPALVIVYSAGAALNYYVAKGFFDTIPRSLDEAAYLDGASKWTVFTRITIPLSKSIIIYTVLTGFISPWADYIFASIILGDKSGKYTIAMGLYGMLSQDNIDKYFKQFAAGAVLVALPIAALFIALQRYYVEGLAGSVKG